MRPIHTPLIPERVILLGSISDLLLQLQKLKIILQKGQEREDRWARMMGTDTTIKQETGTNEGGNTPNAQLNTEEGSNNQNLNNGRRGALIVLEGCDRAGKSTQAKMLVDYLSGNGKPATLMRFPERSTHIGSIINSYLSKDKDCNLDDRAIHLLFSANRWEQLPVIKSHLETGVTVVIDRYAFSGVAFSAAKPGMSLDWCKGSDSGLPKPDLVLFLDLTPTQAEERGGYGNERYEIKQFQERVRENYHKLLDDYWKVIDANKTIEELQKVLRDLVVKAVDSVENKELSTLW